MGGGGGGGGRYITVYMLGSVLLCTRITFEPLLCLALFAGFVTSHYLPSLAEGKALQKSNFTS